MSIKQLAFIITTKCTLRCKLCSVAIPYINCPIHDTLDNIKKEESICFKIYNHATVVELIGGEPLLHPQLAEIISSFNNYKTQFDVLRIITNGTIIPSNEVLKAIRSSGFKTDFILSNYGKLSSKIEKVKETLEENNVAFRIDKYFGDNQYYDGWISYGDYKNKNYTTEQVSHLFKKCISKEMCLNVYQGKLYNCNFSFSADNVTPDKKIDGIEFIDLFDTSISIVKKQEMCQTIFTKPVLACKYCNGFIPEESVRYPGAEQVEK